MKKKQLKVALSIERASLLQTKNMKHNAQRNNMVTCNIFDMNKYKGKKSDKQHNCMQLRSFIWHNYIYTGENWPLPTVDLCRLLLAIVVCFYG